MIILDTCAILELCKEAPSFTAKTFKKIESGACILSISFAEIACKNKIGKLDFGMSVQNLHKEFSEVDTIQIIDIGVNEWLDSIDLAWPENKDPADRLIVAFATKNKLPIVTTDNKITKFYSKILW